MVGVSVCLFCLWISLTGINGIPSQNFVLITWVISFTSIVTYVRKESNFCCLLLSRTMVSSMVLFSFSISLDSVMVICFIQLLIWINKAICFRALHKNPSSMGELWKEGSPLVVETKSIWYHLLIYGIILLDKCFLFTNIQLVFRIMKVWAPVDQFHIRTLLACDISAGSYFFLSRNGRPFEMSIGLSFRSDHIKLICLFLMTKSWCDILVPHSCLCPDSALLNSLMVGHTTAHHLDHCCFV